MARFEPSPHKEEAMEALRNGVTKEECAARFGITIRTAERYLQEIQHPKPLPVAKVLKVEKTAPAVGSKTATKTATGETPLAAITVVAPAPIVFTMGDTRIPLNPKHLYDAFRYYEDIQRMSPDIDDEFSLALLTCVRYVWRRFSGQEAVKVGVTIQEVENDNREDRRTAQPDGPGEKAAN